MDKLRTRLSRLNDIQDENYTFELRKVIFDNSLSKDIEDYYEILKNDKNGIVLRFSAFYCIFTQSRRFEQRYRLFDLVERYICLFNGTNFSYLKNIVYSQYYKFKYLDSMSKMYYQKALEYAESAIGEYKVTSDNIGCFNNFADIILDSIGYTNYVEDEDVSDALQYVDRAIHIRENEKKLKPYANYYCSKARLYAYQEKFEEAKKMIALAMSYEDTSQKDSIVRISNYHNIQLEIKMKEALRLIDSKVSESDARYVNVQNKINEQQSKYIEVMGFFAATIALIIGAVTMTFNISDFYMACALLLVLCGCLVFSFAILKILFSNGGGILKTVISGAVSFILILVGILLGKGII